MSLVFISGAARSGKSAWAEAYALSLAAGHSPLVYIATAWAEDPEMCRRIALHKTAREGKGFGTVERCTDVGGIISWLPPDAVVLLECLGTLLANEMFDKHETGAPGFVAPDFYVRKIFDEVLSLSLHAAHLLVVSNDIFSDGVIYDEPTEKYRQTLGALHVKLAAVAGLAVEFAAGQAFFHRGTR